MNLEARMLESVQHALTQHAEKCLAPPTAILLNPADHSLLDWSEFSGIPVEADPKVGAKRIVIRCDRHGRAVEETVRELESFIQSPTRRLVTA